MESNQRSKKFLSVLAALLLIGCAGLGAMVIGSNKQLESYRAETSQLQETLQDELQAKEFLQGRVQQLEDEVEDLEQHLYVTSVNEVLRSANYSDLERGVSNLERKLRECQSELTNCRFFGK